MALLQKDAHAAPTSQAVPDMQENEQACPVVEDADAQDEQLWESQFAASQDTLAQLAARSREHRNAGRAKKIGS